MYFYGNIPFVVHLGKSLAQHTKLKIKKKNTHIAKSLLR